MTLSPQRRWAVCSLVTLTLTAMLLACGGSQSGEVTNNTSAQAEPPAAPEPVVYDEPEPQVYYQIFWDDLHVLTVYRGAGSIRSEESDNPNDRFSGRSAFMSAVSHYVEREPQMRTLIDQAETFDAFIQILTENDYEIREAHLEQGL